MKQKYSQKDTKKEDSQNETEVWLEDTKKEDSKNEIEVWLERHKKGRQLE